MLKRISKAKMTKIVKFNEAPAKEIYLDAGNGDKVSVTVRPTIGYQEMVIFVDKVSNMCIVNGSYHPEIFDLAYGTCVLSFYTNLNLEDAETIYSFIKSNAYETVLSNINDNLRDAAIERTKAIVAESNTASKLDNLVTQLTELAQTAQKKMEDIDPSIDLTKLMEVGTALSEKSEGDIVKAILEEKEKATE